MANKRFKYMIEPMTEILIGDSIVFLTLAEGGE